MLHSVELKMTIVCLDLYGPYVDRELFWINIFKMEGLMSSKLILGGDLKFSIGLSEVWGEKVRVDNLSDFFLRQMESASLVDLALDLLLPTWNNRRVGCENICKRLIGSFFLLIFWIVICISDNGLAMEGIQTIILSLCIYCLKILDRVVPLNLMPSGWRMRILSPF